MVENRLVKRRKLKIIEQLRKGKSFTSLFLYAKKGFFFF